LRTPFPGRRPALARSPTIYRSTKVILFAVIFSLGPHVLTAQEPLLGDRPDFTEGSSTVGRCRLQIESGYTYYHDTRAGEQLE
jgi:hypothetical protein